MLPNFLVIGTYRAGTTWLHEVLKLHPQCYLPSEKEVMYFSRHYEKGVRWYEEFYSAWNGEKAVGEICPAYLGDDHAPERISHDLPDAQLFAIVRRPIEQVVSHYQLRQSRGLTSNPIEREMDEYPNLINAALYHRNLLRYEPALRAGRLTVLFYDDLVKSPQDFLEGVYARLGLEWFWPPQAQMRENAGRSTRSPFVEKLVSVPADLLRRNGMLKLKVLLNSTGLPKAIRGLNSHKGGPARAALPDAVRRKIAEVTAEDRRLLGSMTGRDLSQWL